MTTIDVEHLRERLAGAARRVPRRRTRRPARCVPRLAVGALPAIAMDLEKLRLELGDNI